MLFPSGDEPIKALVGFDVGPIKKARRLLIEEAVDGRELNEEEGKKYYLQIFLDGYDPTIAVPPTITLARLPTIDIFLEDITW